MAIATMAILLLVIAAAAASDCRGAADGTVVNRGRYWYECWNGRLTAKGCLAPDDSRLPVGGTYDSNGYRLQCVNDGGYMAFTFKGCVYNGQAYELDQMWNDAKYVYKCIKVGDHLRTDVAGCMDQGRRVELNEKVNKGTFVFQCKKTENGTCSMCPVACVSENREIGLGGTFEKGDFWFTCLQDSKNRRKVIIQPTGCMYNGQRYNDQGRFYKQDTVYQCYAQDGEAITRPVGCAQTENGATIERKFGEKWYEGSSPYRYEVICDQNEGDKTAITVQTACQYDGRYNIDPGCYQVVEKSAIGCSKEGNGLRIVTVRMADILQITGKGLRLC